VGEMGHEDAKIIINHTNKFTEIDLRLKNFEDRMEDGSNEFKKLNKSQGRIEKELGIKAITNGHDKELLESKIDRVERRAEEIDQAALKRAENFTKVDTTLAGKIDEMKVNQGVMQKSLSGLEGQFSHLQRTIGEKVYANGFTKEKLETLDKQDETMIEILINTRELVLTDMANRQGKKEGKEEAEKEVEKKISIQERIRDHRWRWYEFAALILIAVLSVVFAIPSINGYSGAHTWLDPIAKLLGFYHGG
jgi:hypothetical protein